MEFVKGVQSAAAGAEKAIKQAGEQAAETAGYVSYQAYSAAQKNVEAATNFVKDQTSFVGEHANEFVTVDEIGRKIASLGTPAILFAVAASVASGMGLVGGAVVTTALAMLGGPFGMVGGLIAMGVLTVIADAVSKYGIEAVLVATFNARREQGATLGEIHQGIDNLWISDEFKLKLKKLFLAP